MEFRKYIFAIVFMKDGKTRFLVFHRRKNWRGWEFLKGGIKDNEIESECLKREILEETGARKYKIFKTGYRIRYKWPKSYVKDNKKFRGADGKLYLVQLFDKKVKIDRDEHDGFKWVSGKDILKYLTHPEKRNAVKYVFKNYKIS
jgi:8-oxo-dGTP pyrophosphatase MutT (NUDIX family)